MNKTTDHNAAITAHWSRRDPLAWIRARLAEQGIDRPDHRAIARYDQIHAGGLKAVEDLADLAPIQPGQRVVDLGGGLGGAARWLAAERDCTVLCTDLTPGLASAGQALTDWCGLGERVAHWVADALTLPLANGSVQGVWVQHLALHIPDKAALWREAARVLAPGGWLAFHEWVAGSGNLLQPSPWGVHSFLDSPDLFLAELARAGLTVTRQQDVTAVMAEGYARQLAALSRAGRADNPVLPAGEVLTVMDNARRNLQEGRAGCVMGMALKT